jgi:hypothetical protein
LFPLQNNGVSVWNFLSIFLPSVQLFLPLSLPERYLLHSAALPEKSSTDNWKRKLETPINKSQGRILPGALFVPETLKCFNTLIFWFGGVSDSLNAEVLSNPAEVEPTLPENGVRAEPGLFYI